MEDKFVKTSFDHWYPLLKDYTFESVYISLTPEFIEYLVSDGIIMPNKHEDFKSCDFKEIESFITSAI